MIKLADGRGLLYQWDTGRQVECDAEQVHFSNHHYGTSIDVDVQDGKATIPNQLLTSAIPLKAWAWVKDSNGEYTKEEQIFLVAKRNKPSDYVYTPAEIKTWQDLQNQIGDLSNLTTEHKDNLVNAINDAAESGGASTAEEVGYTNTQLPNVKNVKTALDELVTKSHSHDNKSVLDKLSVADGKLQYDGSDVGLKGEKGDTGATPDIQIGTVETLPAESPATASIGGTPENPLLNLGIPRGKDGGGINVTGATVGQTVRIAAVDDNGVPTAWEAVDSEEKWELIESYDEITDPVTKAVFSHENMKNYKKLYCVFGGISNPDKALCSVSVNNAVSDWDFLYSNSAEDFSVACFISPDPPGTSVYVSGIYANSKLNFYPMKELPFARGQMSTRTAFPIEKVVFSSMGSTGITYKYVKIYGVKS